MFLPTIREQAGNFGKHPPGSCAWTWLTRKTPPHDVFAAIDLRVDDGAARPDRQKPPKVELVQKTFAAKNGVGIVVVLLRLEDQPYTYMMPINHYSDVYKSPLTYWRDSPSLTIYLFEGDENPVYAFALKENFRGFWAPVVEKVERMPMWTEEQWNEAVATFSLTAQEVWDSVP